MRTVIKGGTVVTASDTYAADVLIEDEKIAAIGRDLSGEATIDAVGAYVIPGAIDVQYRRLARLLHQRFKAEYSGTLLIYAGWCEPTTLTTEPGWLIVKLIYSGWHLFALRHIRKRQAPGSLSVR